MSEEKVNETILLSDEEARKRKSRNKAIGWILAFLVVLFYVVTVFKFGPAVLKKPM